MRYYIVATTILMIIYYFRLWLKGRKIQGSTKFAIINLFDNGIDGFGELIGFCLYHILYCVGLFIWII
jgi:uncharacterized membrane protein